MILFKSAHPNYIDKWQSFELTRSFKQGARWNSPRTPVLYMSSNVQNAMLELANYAPTPKMANALNVMGVFSVSDEINLYQITLADLPQRWNEFPYPHSMQKLGDAVLNSGEYDGMIVPSIAVSNSIVRHTSNLVRLSSYANVVLNPEREVVKNSLKLLNIHRPIYNPRMFG